MGAMRCAISTFMGTTETTWEDDGCNISQLIDRLRILIPSAHAPTYEAMMM